MKKAVQDILKRIELQEEKISLEQRLASVLTELKTPIVFECYEGFFVIETPTGLYGIQVRDHELVSAKKIEWFPGIDHHQVSDQVSDASN